MNDYTKLIELAKAHPSELPGQIHHVLPRSIHRLTPTTMPVNHPDNLVYLSHQQHLMAHWLLFKMYKGTTYGGAMAKAFCFMMDIPSAGAAPTLHQADDYAAARVEASRSTSDAVSKPVTNVVTGERFENVQVAAKAAGVTGAGMSLKLGRDVLRAHHKDKSSLHNMQFDTIEIDGRMVDNFTPIGDQTIGLGNIVSIFQVTRALRVPNMFLRDMQDNGATNKDKWLCEISGYEEIVKSHGRYSVAVRSDIPLALSRMSQAKSFIEDFS